MALEWTKQSEQGLHFMQFVSPFSDEWTFPNTKLEVSVVDIRRGIVKTGYHMTLL